MDVLLYSPGLLARSFELYEQDTSRLPHYQHVGPTTGLPQFEEHQPEVVGKRPFKHSGSGLGLYG